MQASKEERQKLVRPLNYTLFGDDIYFAESGLRSIWLMSNADAMDGRKYFISNKHYLGLVPDASQEGDSICIFIGGKTPFVIRPAGENYQLIGACYVHGVMYGEAMEDFEKQGRKMQDIVLI